MILQRFSLEGVCSYLRYKLLGHKIDGDIFWTCSLCLEFRYLREAGCVQCVIHQTFHQHESSNISNTVLVQQWKNPSMSFLLASLKTWTCSNAFFLVYSGIKTYLIFVLVNILECWLFTWKVLFRFTHIFFWESFLERSSFSPQMNSWIRNYLF